MKSRMEQCEKGNGSPGSITVLCQCAYRRHFGHHHKALLREIQVWVFCWLWQASLVAQTVKCQPAIRETWVLSLGWEDPLEKAMATHSSALAWKIPWAEESGGLQVMGSRRVRHNWATNTFTFLDSTEETLTPSLHLTLNRLSPWRLNLSSLPGQIGLSHSSHSVAKHWGDAYCMHCTRSWENTVNFPGWALNLSGRELVSYLKI